MSDLEGKISFANSKNYPNIYDQYGDGNVVMLHFSARCSGCWFDERIYIEWEVEYVNKDGKRISSYEYNHSHPIYSGENVRDQPLLLAFIPQKKPKNAYAVSVSVKIKGVNAQTVYGNRTYALPENCAFRILC